MGFHTPPRVALLLTLALMVYLFRRDIREKPDVTGALWLPLLWWVITCSRGVSFWLNIFGLPVPGATSLEEGSPFDAWFIFALIAVGCWILNQRQVRLSEVIQSNGWLIAFLLYCFISIAWSDFPFVAFKRWIKILGNPIMVLIVLTEPDPKEAVIRLMKRCAYVVVPVSILFIKYYPELGRDFDPWTGAPTNNGIAQGKNLLGADCFILGFFFFWHLLQTWPAERSIWRRNELRLIAGFSVGIGWLLYQAHSATSFICLGAAVLIAVLVGRRFINKNFIGTYLLAALALYVVADQAFGISGHFSEALGRNSNLSGRTEIWGHVLSVPINPLFGTGFDSFWLGERGQQMGELYWYHLSEAHNGYIETYLNLGLVGLAILLGWIIATFGKIRLELFRNLEWGRYWLGLLTTVVLYNWTEAGFREFNPVCFAFFIIAMAYPKPPLDLVEEPLQIIESRQEIEVTCSRKEAEPAGLGVAIQA